jgi:two-component system OmpR family response regulator
MTTTRTAREAPVIFVVEDEALVREFLEWALGRSYRVRAFGDGREALAALDDETPDLLLSDLDLPGLSGETLAAGARALARPPTVVFMSADPERLHRAEAGADAVLEKPFSLVDALEVVEACLVEREAAPRLA